MDMPLELRGTIIPAKALLEKVKSAIEIADKNSIDTVEIDNWSDTLKHALELFAEVYESVSQYEKDYLIANIQYAYAGLRMVMYNAGKECLQKERSNFVQYALKEQEKTAALFRNGDISVEEYVEKQSDALQAMTAVLWDTCNRMSIKFGVTLN